MQKEKKLKIIGASCLILVGAVFLITKEHTSPKSYAKKPHQNVEAKDSSYQAPSAQLPMLEINPEVSTMQDIAGHKCPELIQRKTGAKVFFPYKTDTDGSTFVMYEWKGEKGSKFKTASCTVNLELGDVSALVIDDKVLIGR